MARVNVSIPDELLNDARRSGLNVSRLAALALRHELERKRRVAALDRYLASLDDEIGTVPEDERDAARRWADRELPGKTDRAA